MLYMPPLMSAQGSTGDDDRDWGVVSEVATGVWVEPGDKAAARLVAVNVFDGANGAMGLADESLHSCDAAQVAFELWYDAGRR